MTRHKSLHAVLYINELIRHVDPGDFEKRKPDRVLTQKDI